MELRLINLSYYFLISSMSYMSFKNNNNSHNFLSLINTLTCKCEKLNCFLKLLQKLLLSFEYLFLLVIIVNSGPISMYSRENQKFNTSSKRNISRQNIDRMERAFDILSIGLDFKNLNNFRIPQYSSKIIFSEIPH